MNVFELFGTIAINNRDANAALQDTSEKAERTGARLRQAFKNVGSATMKVGKAVGGAAVAVGSAWVATIESTRDYRTAMAQLDTAFATSNHSAEAARNTYKGLQGVMGDTDAAVEAASALALMCDNEEDLAKWVEVCTGAFAEHQGKLPIEGLAEAANETANVGVVTGNLADALNWVGISEDEFNLKLRACRTEQERQKLILDTLYPMYKDSADLYRENAESVIAANEAQDKLNSAMAKLGEIGEPILTGVKGWVADMVTTAVPHLETLIGKLTNFDETMTNEVWPWIQNEAKVKFGIDLPDWETFKGNVETWWTDTRTNIESACNFALAFAGFKEWTQADDEALDLWWDGVFKKLDEACQWVLHPKLPTDEETTAFVESLTQWWQGVTETARDMVGLTPEKEDKYIAYEEDLHAAGQGNDLAQEIINASTRNTDSNYDFSAIFNAIFGRNPASVPVEVSEDSEANMQGQVDSMNLEGEVTLYPDTSRLNINYGGIFSGGGNGNRRVPQSKAVGLDEVPYDGYYAHLHKGEAILNRVQADQWRGGSTGKIEALLTQLVANTRGGQQVVLDSGVMVGQLAPMMDARLGTISGRKGRGN